MITTEQLTGIEFEPSRELAEHMVRMAEDYEQFVFKYPKKAAS